VVIEVEESDMCPDCNTPAIWFNENYELLRICHDQSCPTSGTPGISDKLHLKLYGKVSR
jgi:hypothetical protein